jgi:single-strand DNA-binding protein
MANFNRVILVGNLTRDPELRYTSKGLAIAKIGLAVNRAWKTETGELKEETTFVDIDLFGRTAEIAGQYLKKGNPALIEGRLKLDTWDDKQTNQKRSKLTVVGESLQLLSSRSVSPEASAAVAAVATAAPARPQPAVPSPPAPEPAAPQGAEASTSEEDDVPF